MRLYTYKDQVFAFEGSVSVQNEDSWAMPWRIDYHRLPLLGDIADRGAGDCAGIRLTFSTDSMELKLMLEGFHPELRLGLFVDGLFIQEGRIQRNTGEVLFDPLPPGLKTVEIELDHRYPLKLKAVGVDEHAKISLVHASQKRWAHYGGFLGQAKSVTSARKVWTHLVAKKLNLQLVNLCYDRSTVFEPMTACMIRDLPVNFITAMLEWGPREGPADSSVLVANLIGWVQLIREKHPDVPVALIAPMVDQHRDVGINVITTAVAACQAYGDQHTFGITGSEIYYLENHEQFDEQVQSVLAERFLDIVFFKTFC